MSSCANHAKRSHRSEKLHRANAASMMRFAAVKQAEAHTPLRPAAGKHAGGRTGQVGRRGRRAGPCGWRHAAPGRGPAQASRRLARRCNLIWDICQKGSQYASGTRLDGGAAQRRGRCEGGVGRWQRLI